VRDGKPSANAGMRKRGDRVGLRYVKLWKNTFAAKKKEGEL